jgi:hypothetical protein
VLNPGSDARSTRTSVAAGAVALSVRVSTTPDGGPDTGPATAAARSDGAASGGNGVIAMASGVLPTVIGVPAVLVAIVIGVTVPELILAT